jgi:formylglycine-generating enzyme required for sulfatase activity
MKIKGVFLAAILAAVLCFSGNLLAVCPSVDLTGDCFVDFEDFAIMAGQWLAVYDSDDLAAMALEWLTEGIPEPDITWVSVAEAGFTGQMSKYETTNAQYCQFLNAAKASNQITVYSNIVYATSDTGHSQPYFSTEAADSYSQITYSGGTFSVRSRDGYSMASHPVVMVSWYGATAFCNYYGYRLPTEWEWQAVADYDGSYTYGCGTTINQSKANYYDNGYANPLSLSNWPYTSPVGYYPAYGYGMCDMAGNVWEWTSLIYGGSFRVFRGGSWFYYAYNCTVSDWAYYDPGNLNFYLGFRVCR